MLATLVLATITHAATAQALVPVGGLGELAGTGACLTTDGSLGGTAGVCTAVPEMDQANSMVISPDGKFAYVNGKRGGIYNVIVLSRNTTTGVLSPLTGASFCYTEDGSGSGGAGTCTT